MIRISEHNLCGLPITVILAVVILILSACNFGLKEELNFQEAELFIKNIKVNNEVDSILLQRTNADNFEVNGGKYLFIVNSFNGNFNGWVYSDTIYSNLEGTRFGDFIIIRNESPLGNWTQVYGKW